MAITITARQIKEHGIIRRKVQPPSDLLLLRLPIIRPERPRGVVVWHVAGILLQQIPPGRELRWFPRRRCSYCTGLPCWRTGEIRSFESRPAMDYEAANLRGAVVGVLGSQRHPEYQEGCIMPMGELEKAVKCWRPTAPQLPPLP
jgi:hypothetical protein